MIALLVVIWLLWRLLLAEKKTVEHKKGPFGGNVSKIQLDVCVHVCM